MLSKSKSRQQLRGKSLQTKLKKDKKKMAFNMVRQHDYRELNDMDSPLSFQMARLAVNQKLLYLQTCVQKKASQYQTFVHYPYTNYSYQKSSYYTLIGNTAQRNPQLCEQSRGKIINDQSGVHLVQHVSGFTQRDGNAQKNNLEVFKANQQLSQANQILFNGLALSLFSDRAIFQGCYHDGQFCGQCLYLNAQGDLYLGHFRHHLKNGLGTFYSFEPKEFYKGQWQADLPHGQGIYNTTNSSYQGSFQNGKKNGFGIQKFNNADYFAGQYVNGISQGYGEYYWADGSCYKGDFSHGIRHGYGIWEDQDQAYYGCYEIDKKHGLGVYTWKNKRIYKGNFIEDFRQGYGQIYSIGGVIHQKKLLYKGAWEKGNKNLNIKIQQSQITQLYRFLQEQNDFLRKIPLKKKRSGHKNCMPSGYCIKKP